jgi:hypothetical protein
MAATDTASRVSPYVEQLLENNYARENLREGVSNLRAAYARSQKRRVKAARDEKLRRQVQAAASSIAEAGRALSSGRQKPKRRWGRRLLVVLGVGAVTAGAALAASEDLRNEVFGDSEATQAPEPTSAPSDAESVPA